MDLLKVQLERLQKQLAGLSASQKMLTVALVAIMTLTLVWWGRYAGEAEMEPLLDQAFSHEEIARITTDLASRNIRYSVVGDRILLPAERKLEVLASLSYSHLLPRDTKVGFDEMIKQMSPWASEKMTDAMFNRGKEMMLSQIIRNFPNVADAEVMIDPTRERHIEGSVEPSATVTITMQGNAPAAPQLADAAADVVQGAQSGLSRARIKVVVGGVPRRLRDRDAEESFGADGNDQLELVQKNEVRLSNKVKDYLSYIPELKVSVTVRLNTTSVHEQSKTFDAGGVIQKEKESASETEDTVGSRASEANVVPNSGLSLPPTSGPAVSPPAITSSREKVASKYENFVPETNRQSKTPAGDVTVIAATVRVPLSYFAGIYARQSGSAKGAAITDQQLQPLIDGELPKIKNDVMKCTGVQSKEDVAVETYSDALPVFTTAAPQAASPSVSLLLGGHGREIGLGALAVMSLFMVSMMVRKGAPAATIVVPAGGAGINGSGGSAVARDETSGDIFDEAAFDEDEVTVARQAREHVSALVKENPDAAAKLVKQWLNRV